MDFREEHLKTAKFNAEKLGLKNIIFKQADIYESIPTKKKLDMITLDVASPEKVVENAHNKLKHGGFLVVYCPQITQVQDVIQKMDLFETKVEEVMLRPWKVEGQVCRPEHMVLMHTGFLVFGRKVL